jgi:hypothetical protein
MLSAKRTRPLDGAPGLASQPGRLVVLLGLVAASPASLVDSPVSLYRPFVDNFTDREEQLFGHYRDAHSLEIRHLWEEMNM